ncbi:MAG: leucine-rich repeat protein [Lachnospiraceae bacterium]|nr:leucine-rich repeat protein [Lachnospiraceae bacterium]
MKEDGYEIKDGILDLSECGIKAVEDKQFLGIKQLRAVIMPEGIEHVGDWAFAKCSNLEAVSFCGKFRKDLFGRNVFKGCEELSFIRFADTDDTTARLLALSTNRLEADHLVRADDIGQKSWYEKWDISLLSLLKSDDEKNAIAAALCGEEDISYDGIGSVDGELPGESADYVTKKAYEKCMLCYIRLENDRFLSEDARRIVEDHISKNRLGSASGSSFYSIFSLGGSDLSYLARYIDIVRPDKEMIRMMMDSLSPKDVYAMSYLVERSGGIAGDDLML